MNTLSGYSKLTLSDLYLLTAAGGHKAVSYFATADSLKNYLPLVGSYIGTTPVQITSTTLDLTGIGNITMSEKINGIAKITKSGSGGAILNIEETLATINYSHIYVSSSSSNHATTRPLVLLYGYGNVGIGTFTPQYKLDVNGIIRANGNVLLESANNTTGGGIAFWNDSGYVNGTINAASLILNNGSTSGNVGIGTIDPKQKLHVNGDIFLNNYLYFTDSAAARIKYGTHTTTALGSYPLPSLGSSGLGLFVRPSKSTDEGGIIITEDTCMIFNSADAGWSFQVHNTDLNLKDFSGTDGDGAKSRVFGIIDAGNYAWSRGGFLKSGSDNTYVLLGGGSHKLESSLSVSHAKTSETSDETLRFKFIMSSSSTNRDLNTGLFGGGLMRNYTGYAASYFTNHPTDMRYGCVLELSACGKSIATNDLAGQLAWDINHRGTDSTRYLWWRANDDTNFSTAKWHRLAYAEEIPTVTNYYWADISILSASDDTKVPTFGGIKTNGNIILGSEGILGFGSSIPSKYINSAAVNPDASAVWLATTGNVTGVASLEASGILFDGGTIKMWSPIDSAVQLIDSDDGTVYNFYHSGNLTKLSLLSNDVGYITGSYLPLAGGLMNASAFISWNNGADGNDVSDWNFTTNGLRIISSASTNTNSPRQYATALHVKGRYGFLLASEGGSSANAFYIKNVHNTIWNTLIHSNNYTDYTVTKTGSGASGTWGINITGNAATATSATNADTVDGFHATRGDNKPWGTIPAITTSGWMDVGKLFEFHYDNTTGSDYSTILTCTGNHGNVVNLPSASGTLALTSQIPTVPDVSKYLPLAGGTMTGNIYFSESSVCAIKYGTHTTSALKGITLPGLGSNALGLYVRPSKSNDEGGILISEDTMLCYNSFDSGWGFQLHDKDLNLTDLSTDATRVFGVSVSGTSYLAWSLGGFAKSGSSNSYVLLGGGGHKALSDFSMAHSHPYLATTGGTMTGNITLGTYGMLGFGSSIATKYLDSAAPGAEANAVWLVSTGGGGEAAGICVDGNTITMWSPMDTAPRFIDSDDGKVYTIIHSGNYTSYFSDTNTWRPITNSYSSTATDTSLSLKGANDLYNALVNGYASSAGTANASYYVYDYNATTTPIYIGYSGAGLSTCTTFAAYGTTSSGARCIKDISVANAKSVLGIPTVYARDIGVNGNNWTFYSSTNAATTSIYAPTSVGSSYQILVSSGSTSYPTPYWENRMTSTFPGIIWMGYIYRSTRSSTYWYARREGGYATVSMAISLPTSSNNYLVALQSSTHTILGGMCSILAQFNAGKDGGQSTEGPLYAYSTVDVGKIEEAGPDVLVSTVYGGRFYIKAMRASDANNASYYLDGLAFTGAGKDTNSLPLARINVILFGY